jgi:hypothetical protein
MKTANMKWERLTTKFSDGTYWVGGYKLGEYVIKPQYIINSNRPIGYNIYEKGEYITSKDTLKEAKAFVESYLAYLAYEQERRAV